MQTNFPPRLIDDKAYNGDPLDRKLAEQGIDVIAPHRRKLRRYRRRWKVERLFAWLQDYRRLIVRYELHVGTTSPPRGWAASSSY